MPYMPNATSLPLLYNHRAHTVSKEGNVQSMAVLIVKLVSYNNL